MFSVLRNPHTESQLDLTLDQERKSDDQRYFKVKEKLADLGVNNKRKFSKRLTEIQTMVDNKSKIEKLTEELGKLLGFESYFDNSEGAADGIWRISEDLVIAFEDKIYKSDQDSVKLDDLRQFVSHESFTRTNYQLSSSTKVKLVLVTNRSFIKSDYGHLIEDYHYYWPYEDFKKWSNELIGFIRAFSSNYVAIDEEWNKVILTKFHESKFKESDICKKLQKLSELIVRD